jgi:hypothetical protein
LLAEPEVLGYVDLQWQISRLLRGEEIRTTELPKPLAKTGIGLQQAALHGMESIEPSGLASHLVNGVKGMGLPEGIVQAGQRLIDTATDTFLQPWQIDIADDHYALDCRRARELLGWCPEHSLKETLPVMLRNLQSDPRRRYRENHLEGGGAGSSEK